MPGQSHSTYSRLAIDGKQFCFRQIVPTGRGYEVVDNSEDSMCGDLDHHGEVDLGCKDLRFRIFMRPSPEELDLLLPWIGFDETTNTFELSDDFSSRSKTVLIDRVAQVHEYTTCYVDKAIFTGARGRKTMGLDLWVIATNEDPTSAWSGVTDISPRTVGYPLTRGTLELLGSTRLFNQYTCVIDNNFDTEFNNSRVITAADPADRVIYLATSTPFINTTVDLYNDQLDDVTGATGQLAFSRGSQSLEFNFRRLVNMTKIPEVPYRKEIRLGQLYQAYMDADENKPLQIVNVPA